MHTRSHRSSVVLALHHNSYSRPASGQVQTVSNSTRLTQRKVNKVTKNVQLRSMTAVYKVVRWYLCYRSLGQLSRYSNSLRVGQFGDRIPVGERFSAHVQTGPGSHPGSCTMRAGSFPGVKWPGRGVYHPYSYGKEVKERVALQRYSPSVPSLSVLG